MIEDNAQNLLSSIATHKILLRRPWNESDVKVAAASKIHVANDYFDILEIVNDISNRKSARGEK